ncbi:MAG: hypothetical protein M3N49_05905 [Candidatus Eremiobacteraeota bacterium]|nr:hypothetical protein [Candidatus Eremiobacteraeota bacterium]
MRATWKPHEKHGELTERGDLPDSVYAFPKERKEPMTDASHVRNAIARFDQVTGVSDDERELAFANIEKAAKHYGVEMSEKDWHELGRGPSTGRTAPARKKSARKAASTRKKRGTGSTTTPARKRGAKRAAATRKKTATGKKAASKKPAAKKTARKTAAKKR